MLDDNMFKGEIHKNCSYNVVKSDLYKPLYFITTGRALEHSSLPAAHG